MARSEKQPHWSKFEGLASKNEPLKRSTKNPFDQLPKPATTTPEQQLAFVQGALRARQAQFKAAWIGLTIVTLVPAAGTSAMAGLALTGLAYDIYAGLGEYEDFKLASTAADTDLDKVSAKLSRRSTRPVKKLAVSIVAWALGPTHGASGVIPRRSDTDHQAFLVERHVEHTGAFQTQQLAKQRSGAHGGPWFAAGSRTAALPWVAVRTYAPRPNGVEAIATAPTMRSERSRHPQNLEESPGLYRAVRMTARMKDPLIRVREGAYRETSTPSQGSLTSRRCKFAHLSERLLELSLPLFA